jgi:hypothetical protein
MVLLVATVTEVAAALVVVALCIQFHCLVLALLDPDLLCPEQGFHSG